jgi:hypothetical protein
LEGYSFTIKLHPRGAVKLARGCLAAKLFLNHQQPRFRSHSSREELGSGAFLLHGAGGHKVHAMELPITGEDNLNFSAAERRACAALSVPHRGAVGWPWRAI